MRSEAILLQEGSFNIAADRIEMSGTRTLCTICKRNLLLYFSFFYFAIFCPCRHLDLTWFDHFQDEKQHIHSLLAFRFSFTDVCKPLHHGGQVDKWGSLFLEPCSNEAVIQKARKGKENNSVASSMDHHGSVDMKPLQNLDLQAYRVFSLVDV